jgi:hypothetical protein
MMKKDDQDFLEELSGFPPNTFENTFLKITTRLGLEHALNGNELRLLYDAAFPAALCNIAMNGLGGCGGRIKPEREANRTRLENEFMAARDRFYASPSWKNLPAAQRGMIQRILLRVYVRPDKLAV